MIRSFIFICWISISVLGVAQTPDLVDSNLGKLQNLLLNPSENYVMVVAHRGDWRNFPENSISSIQSCIDMGVDMVEVDVAMTKDSVLILMHDNTLDRTTTGKGKVTNYSFEEIQNFYLRDGLGRPTPWKIPTLEEALLLCQDRILINLDKADNYISLIYPILKETGTVKQVAIGSYSTLDQMREKTGNYLDSIYFMPKVKDGTKDIKGFLYEYFDAVKCPVVQMKFDSDQSGVIDNIPFIKNAQKWTWINTISSNRSGGHHDDRATYDLEESYGWVISHGFNMIQTDRPELLINYLENKGLHDLSDL